MTGRKVAVGYFVGSLLISALAGLVATAVMPFRGATFAGSWLLDTAIVPIPWNAAAPFVGPRLERWLATDDEADR
jgi:hypothetical protein